MPTQMHRLNATMILPGPHACPCAHADGYGHQTGRSFARSPSSIELLEHTCQTGNRSAAPEKSEGALTNLQVDALGVTGRARDGRRPGVFRMISVRLPGTAAVPIPPR